MRAKKQPRLVVITLAMALLLTACSPPAGPIQEEKVIITVLADISAKDMDLYWAKLAAKFPEVKLDVTVQTTLAPADEIARRVAHGDVADLVFSQSLNAELSGLSECFLDLSGKSYTSRYQTSYLNALDVDGRIYCLPAGLTAQGLVYNQTFFDENGLEVPTNYEEFAALCGQIQALGTRPGMLLSGNRAPAELFARCYSLDKPHSLAAWKWAGEFNTGTATAQEGDLDSVFDMLDSFSALGLTDPGDYSFNRWGHLRKLATREVTMILGDASVPIEMANQSSTDTFRLMPLFSPTDGKGYFFTVPLSSLAVSKQVAEDPAKAEAMDRILEYITSEEGQRELMDLDKALISPVTGMREIGDEAFYRTAKDLLNDERLLNIVEFPGFAYTLNMELGRYLHGETSQAQLTQAMDDAAHGRAGTQQQAIATAERSFTLAETNALALDAMCEALDADVALLRQSSSRHSMYQYCLNGAIYEGPVTETDLLCIQPAVENSRTDYPLARLEMTGAQLLELLSYEGAYYYHGVTVLYRWDGARGGYAAEALLDGAGNKLDPETHFTVAFLSQSPLGEQNYLSRELSGATLWTALEEYMKARGTLTPSDPNPAVYEK
ncbi:extracellular solute-binding protein [Bittarella massiliensis (ex Durand et al. 2017)]|uniref:extracellular solute-binding protein n=1 Tax=Bittarella massiliensis (ex Durand et al. 2017) TaxID=1720313 RepID=UPI001AA13672|nr:extracellular solute-binding protein [Bittarella massiliensis (ex Durand et al. 2017)]MBO1678507.1 extracellular solute-binding protein [Bittarella massiliensis (ex Durand et al. 2017)]